MKIKKDWIFILLIGLLVVVSVVQAVQLSGIQDQIVDTGGSKVITASQTTPTRAAPAPVTKASSSPSMVGGC